MALTDAYLTVHPGTEEYIFSSVAHGKFSKISHILGYKARINKFRNIEVLCVLCDKGIKPDTSDNRKYTKSWTVKNTLLNQNWVKEEIKKKKIKSLEFNEMKI